MREDPSGERYGWGERPVPMDMIRVLFICMKELGVPFINISAPSIVSGMSGESEKTLRDTFEEAKVRPFSFPCYLKILIH